VGRLCPTARSERALRKRLTGALFLRGVLLMRDDTFADDYANVVRCADCRCLLGTSSSSPVKLCAECALGETPPEKIAHCHRCGDQRPRLAEDWVGDTCGECELNAQAEREAFIRKAQKSGAWDAACKRLSEIRWSDDGL
jgi:hypothetical protein